jgi:hypothetical protein
MTYWFPYTISDDPCEDIDLRKVIKKYKLVIDPKLIDEHQCVYIQYEDKDGKYLVYRTVDHAKRLFAKGYKFDILSLDFVDNIEIRAIERYAGYCRSWEDLLSLKKDKKEDGKCF